MSTKDKLWTPDEISQSIEGCWLVPPEGEVNITGVAYYVAHIKPGDLVFTHSRKFWGMKFTDSADKLAEMQKWGARMVITDTLPKVIPPGLSVYFTANTYKALLKLGTVARNRFKGKVICVTGSVGKSSTKYGLAHILSKQGSTGESNKNFNHSPGVPLSLAQTPTDYSYGVYEFGIDMPHLTLPKALLARPDVAIVTEIQHDHHRFYPTLEAIVDQKSLLFRGLSSDGVVVLNRDTPYYFRLKTAAQGNNIKKMITFGEHRLADVRLIQHECFVDFSRVKTSVFGKFIDYTLSIPGHHNVLNSLAMLAGACAVNANIEQAAEALVELKPLPKHCARKKIPFQNGEYELIDDTISSNPASINAALEYFNLFKLSNGGKKILILGVMDQLGETSAAFHAALADPFLRSDIDKLYGIGSDVKALCDRIPSLRLGLYTEDPDELINSVRKAIKPGDLVMIKGFQSPIMSQILKSLESD
jgi:UDP-N-acetylmuramoyl-tripeptide--D-alanyl-D-alanine ligase